MSRYEDEYLKALALSNAQKISKILDLKNPAIKKLIDDGCDEFIECVTEITEPILETSLDGDTLIKEIRFFKLIVDNSGSLDKSPSTEACIYGCKRIIDGISDTPLYNKYIQSVKITQLGGGMLRMIGGLLAMSLTVWSGTHLHESYENPDYSILPAIPTVSGALGAMIPSFLISGSENPSVDEWIADPAFGEPNAFMKDAAQIKGEIAKLQRVKADQAIANYNVQSMFADDIVTGRLCLGNTECSPQSQYAAQVVKYAETIRSVVAKRKTTILNLESEKSARQKAVQANADTSWRVYDSIAVRDTINGNWKIEYARGSAAAEITALESVEKDLTHQREELERLLYLELTSTDLSDITPSELFKIMHASQDGAILTDDDAKFLGVQPMGFTPLENIATRTPNPKPMATPRPDQVSLSRTSGLVTVGMRDGKPTNMNTYAADLAKGVPYTTIVNSVYADTQSSLTEPSANRIIASMILDRVGQQQLDRIERQITEKERQLRSSQIIDIFENQDKFMRVAVQEFSDKGTPPDQQGIIINNFLDQARNLGVKINPEKGARQLAQCSLNRGLDGCKKITYKEAASKLRKQNDLRQKLRNAGWNGMVIFTTLGVSIVILTTIPSGIVAVAKGAGEILYSGGGSIVNIGNAVAARIAGPNAHLVLTNGTASIQRPVASAALRLGDAAPAAPAALRLGDAAPAALRLGDAAPAGPAPPAAQAPPETQPPVMREAVQPPPSSTIGIEAPAPAQGGSRFNRAHRLPSLPTRRGRRSSSSSKRRYTHRRRASRTGKGGYRPTKSGRKA